MDRPQPWYAVFLGKAPDLASTRGRRLIIQVHHHAVIALYTVIKRCNPAAAFLIIAEPRGIGHFHPLEINIIPVRLQRLRQKCPQRVGVSLVMDQKIFALYKAKWTFWVT